MALSLLLTKFIINIAQKQLHFKAWISEKNWRLTTKLELIHLVVKLKQKEHNIFNEYLKDFDSIKVKISLLENLIDPGLPLLI